MSLQDKRAVSRLAEMRSAEYGSRGEVIVRYVVMATVVAVLTLIIDSRLVLGWGAVYGLLEAGTAVTLFRQQPVRPAFRYWIALTFYSLAGMCFMTLPLYLIAAQLSDGLTFAGAAGMVGLALYTLQRPHREVGLLLADCCQIAAMMLGLFVILLPRLDGWPEVVTVGFISLATLGYYIASQISGWQLQNALKLEQERSALAEQTRALDQFVGGVAHEFNNDLTAVLGNLDLYDTLATSEERAAALRECRTAAGHASLTVQQLLAASGRLQLAPTDVRMECFLFDLGEALSDLLSPGMTVDILPTDETLLALVDQALLMSSAVQLGLNAQEATGGTGTIHISVERRATSGDLAPLPDQPPPYIALIIEDDGPGVSDTARTLLTDPFFTTKALRKGRGLGLSAVAGFARQSGGGLWIEPGAKGGLRAVVYLVEARSSQLCETTSERADDR